MSFPLDERVVKVVAAVDLHRELEKIALRGARYGFPGWVGHSETKTGKPKPAATKPPIGSDGETRTRTGDTTIFSR